MDEPRANSEEQPSVCGGWMGKKVELHGRSLSWGKTAGALSRAVQLVARSVPDTA